MKKYVFLIIVMMVGASLGAQHSPVRILNFNGDNGYVHDSKAASAKLISDLGLQNGWEVVTTDDPSIFNLKSLLAFDVVIFNNNCGNKGPIFSTHQKLAFQQYIRNGGGFMGIHCSGAIWEEGGEFQQWYEKLIGTKLVDHPKVQSAKLTVEDTLHESTKHLDSEWELTDEWHRFSYNPRENVNVLLSLQEDSYEGEQKMGGDHPFTWYQHYDGGRSFFTSLGHTEEIYKDANFQNLIKGGIIWAISKRSKQEKLPFEDGLFLDLDADHNIVLEDGNKVSSWANRIENNNIKEFVKQDKGRRIKGSGRPRLKVSEPKLNGHNSVVFHRQELVNHNEDAFDVLTTGKGYTWFSVMAVYEQVKGKPGVNSFFGNLRNTNIDKEGNFEGFWGGVNEEKQPWMSARNGLQKGLWNDGSPHVIAEYPLENTVYYLVMGRMGSGLGTVKAELFINTTKTVAVNTFQVNPKANPSKMVIGQERDATNHPGAESFDGEIARFLIFDRPLTNEELKTVSNHLIKKYNIKN